MVPNNNTVYQSGPSRGSGGCRKRNVMGLGLVGETEALSKHGPDQPCALFLSPPPANTHTHKSLIGGPRVCMCVCVCLWLSCPAFPIVRRALPSNKSQSLIPPPLTTKAFPAGFTNTANEIQWVPQIVSFSCFISLPPSFPFFSLLLLTVTSVVSWDRVAGETRPQTDPLRQKSPKYSTAQLSSEKLLLHFNCSSLANNEQDYLESWTDLGALVALLTWKQ